MESDDLSDDLFSDLSADLSIAMVGSMLDEHSVCVFFLGAPLCWMLGCPRLGNPQDIQCIEYGAKKNGQ